MVVDFPPIKPAAIHQCVAQDADSNDCEHNVPDTWTEYKVAVA
jgi:hypothetical protein